MEERYYKEGILYAIKALDDEVQNLRVQRNEALHEKSKERYNDQMLSHILSIQHLRELITDDTEEEA
jgi:hypothetical protein